jgi:hypothetical protein
MKRRNPAAADWSARFLTPALPKFVASFSMLARTTLSVGMTGSVSTTSTRKFFNSPWRGGGSSSL